MEFFKVDINAVAERLDSLPAEEQVEILALLDELNAARSRSVAQDDFLEFVKLVWPAFIEGNHHRTMADAFNRIASCDL